MCEGTHLDFTRASIPQIAPRKTPAPLRRGFSNSKISCVDVLAPLYSFVYTAYMIQRRFPWFLAVALFVIAGIDCIANYNSWYWTIRWLDMPMHFAGGVWVAGVTLWWKFFSGAQETPAVAPTITRLLIWGIGGALIIGLGWEIYESVVTLITQGHINDIQDTVSDLFFDMAGGMFVVFLYKIKKHYA